MRPIHYLTLSKSKEEYFDESRLRENILMAKNRSNRFLAEWVGPPLGSEHEA